MIKHRVLNIILIAIGVLCPIVFPFGYAGTLTDGTAFSELAPIPFLALGPVGFACVLTVLVRERERLRLLAWVPLFLLLLLNLALAEVTDLVFKGMIH